MMTHILEPTHLSMSSGAVCQRDGPELKEHEVQSLVAQGSPRGSSCDAILIWPEGIPPVGLFDVLRCSPPLSICETEEVPLNKRAYNKDLAQALTVSWVKVIPGSNLVVWWR